MIFNKNLKNTLFYLCRGVDHRKVESNKISKSLSVEDTYEKPTEDYNPFSHLENNVGTPEPLSEGQMDIFAGNKVSPDCCPSHYSNKDGCMCSTPEQMKYLSERGSNNKD